MHMLWVLSKECNNENKRDNWKKYSLHPRALMAWSEEVEARTELRLKTILGIKVSLRVLTGWRLGLSLNLEKWLLTLRNITKNS